MKSSKQPLKRVKDMMDDPLPDLLEEEYLKSLSEVERSTMKIAEEHLKTSFSLRKSIGYIKWLSARSN